MYAEQSIVQYILLFLSFDSEEMPNMQKPGRR